MIRANAAIILEKTERQVVRIEQGERVAIVEKESNPSFQSISVGLQGPVGTVAESVLTMAAQAEAAAARAEALAVQADEDLTQLVNSLSSAIAYQSGVLSA